MFTATSNGFWLIPILIKLFSDIILSSVYCYSINQPWKFKYPLILSIFHPFYIVILGGLGPFINIKWK